MKFECLENLFKQYRFIVPDYQRGYAWGNHQVDEFWQDLQNVEPESYHFAGTLILKDLSLPNKGYLSVEVVDGQQRLATSVILLRALRDRITTLGLENEEAFRNIGETYLWCNDNGDSVYPFAYAEGSEARSFFAGHVCGDISLVIASADTRSIYTFNIEQALDKSFRARLRNADHSICADLLDKLTRRLQFNVVLVDAKSFNIHVAFETINNRGRKLSNLERLKNRVMFLTTMLQISARPGEPEDARVHRQTRIRNQMRHSANRAWRTMYNWLGKDHKMQLSDDEFLRNHTLIYFKVDTGEASAVETALFDERFTVHAIKEGRLTTKRLEHYLLSLEEGVVCWFHLHSAERVPYMHAYYLEKIDNLRWAAFKPLLLAAYMRLLHGHEEQIADLTPLESVLEPAAALLREVERFIVLIYLVSGRRSHTGRKDFFAFAHRLYRAKDDLRGNATSAVEYAARYIRACAAGPAKETASGDYIYEDAKFPWDGWLKLDIFRTNILQELGKPGGGYYGLDWTKYLLFEYEENLTGRKPNRKPTQDRKVKSFQKVGSETIEHIYPQNPTEEYWTEKKLAHGNAKRLANSYKNSLGNLLLLSHSKNAALQNYAFPKKRKLYRGGSFSENEVAERYQTWGPKQIVARGVKLLKFAEERWEFSFADWNIKYKDCLVLKDGQ